MFSTTFKFNMHPKNRRKRTCITDAANKPSRYSEPGEEVQISSQKTDRTSL